MAHHEGLSNDNYHNDSMRTRAATPLETTPLPDKAFACPYLKRFPEKYAKVQICSGSGWETVYEVQEHLYQDHLQLPQCNRCLTVFGNNESLNDHTSRSIACLPVDSESDAGVARINKQKEMILRYFIGLGGKTEFDKWTQLYQFLFPEVSDIPDPYITAPEWMLYRREELQKFMDSRMSKHFSESSAIGSPEESLNASKAKEALDNIVTRCIQDYQSSLLFKNLKIPAIESVALDDASKFSQSTAQSGGSIDKYALPSMSIGNTKEGLEKECWNFVWDAYPQSTKRTKDSGYGSLTSALYQSPSQIGPESDITHSTLADTTHSQSLEYNKPQLIQRYTQDKSSLPSPDQPWVSRPMQLRLKIPDSEIDHNSNLCADPISFKESDETIVGDQHLETADQQRADSDKLQDLSVFGSHIGLGCRESFNFEISPPFEVFDQLHENMNREGTADDSGLAGKVKRNEFSTYTDFEGIACRVSAKHSEDTSRIIHMTFDAEKKEVNDDDNEDDCWNSDGDDYYDNDDMSFGFDSGSSSYIWDNDPVGERKVIPLQEGEEIGIHDRISLWQQSTRFIGCSPGSSGTSSEGRISELGNSTNGISSSTTKRKHKGDEESSQAPDGDGDGHRKKQSRIDFEDEEPRLKCPFFQRKPTMMWRNSCKGNGWTTMKDLIDHLNRCHRRPIQCLRCWIIIRPPLTLEAHLNQDPLCTSTQRRHEEGITPETSKTYKKKRKEREKHLGRRLGRDEEWFLLFEVIFPDEIKVPSPFNVPTVNLAGNLLDPANCVIECLQEFVVRFLEVIKSECNQTLDIPTRCKMIQRLSERSKQIQQEVLASCSNPIPPSRDPIRANWITSNSPNPLPHNDVQEENNELDTDFQSLLPEDALELFPDLPF